MSVAAMPTVRLGDQGTMPALGLGTWLLEGEAAREAARHALELGYRHLDTAQAYGNEREVGRGLADSGLPREEVFLTTKVSLDNLAAERVRTSTEESLRRLGVDRVDLLLVHWPHRKLPLEETLAAFTAARAAGLTRHIGVSNFPPRLFARALELAPVVCNQVEYHPFLGQQRLLRTARQAGIALTAYSPLARGEAAVDRTLRDIGARHGKSAAQVALRWLVQQEQVAAIPKAATAAHRRSNLEIFDFELSTDEMEALHRLDRGHRTVDPSFAPDWDA